MPTSAIVNTAILAIAAALCTSCYKRPSVSLSDSPTALPGFDITIPGGIYLTSSANPVGGTHELQSSKLPSSWRTIFGSGAADDKLRVKVTWRAQVQTKETWLESLSVIEKTLETALKAQGTSKAISERIWLTTFPLPESALVMGATRCEPWLDVVVIVGSKGPPSEVEALVSRILKSVHCRLASKTPPNVEFETALPPNFGKLINVDAPTYLSTDGIAVAISFSTGDITRDDKTLKLIMAEIMGWAMEAKSTLKVTTHNVSRPDLAKAKMIVLEGDLGEMGSLAYAGTLYCRDLDLTVMTLVSESVGSLEAAKELASRTRCSREDGQDKHNKSASEVFGIACDSGNADACNTLADLIEQNNATSERGTSQEFRSNACKLGMQTACK